MMKKPQQSISASSSGLLHSLRCPRQLGSRSSSEMKWNQLKKYLINIHIIAIGGETFQFEQALMRPHKPRTRFLKPAPAPIHRTAQKMQKADDPCPVSPEGSPRLSTPCQMPRGENFAGEKDLYMQRQMAFCRSGEE